MKLAFLLAGTAVAAAAVAGYFVYLVIVPAVIEQKTTTLQACHVAMQDHMGDPQGSPGQKEVDAKCRALMAPKK